MSSGEDDLGVGLGGVDKRDMREGENCAYEISLIGLS